MPSNAEMDRVRAHLRNDAFPTEQLRAVQTARKHLDEIEREVVLKLHEQGLSWDAIADIRGTSRQALRRFMERSA